MCRLLALFPPVFFLHASQNRPCSPAGESFFRCFPCSPPLAGAQSRSGRTPKRPFLPQHTPLRPPESLAFLEREQTPTVLLRRFDFGEFCIVSHETSAFSMFSTCLILLCYPIFACFPLSRPISDLCPRAAAVTQTATSRGNTRPTTNRRATPEDKQKKRAGREKAWGG